jgi:ketosteroid isomerase-like protein
MMENEKDALTAIQELHEKDIEASKARDFETLLSLWTEDGVLLEQKGKLLRVLKKQPDGSWKVARVIAHNDP